MSAHLIDPDTDLVRKHYAIIYTPRRKRNRFPENCVQIKDSEEEAVTAANPDAKHYPALVYGPARSSEGFKLYYLIQWLDTASH